MGGSGSWSLAAAMPDKWAAVVPLCGNPDLSSASKIKDLPLWCFIGDKDSAKLVDNNRAMIKALKDAGGSPMYDEFKDVGHNCWDRAYSTQVLYDWMLKHSRK
jgi:predicted peptidase